ncbi:AAA family ATPase [Sphingomonas sp. Xoc002]|uniref:AAA family ATPase n=1 Tax=Sphingomonas sp. Xoc002 TaxID=2837624 RepID=UPI003D167A8D
MIEIDDRRGVRSTINGVHWSNSEIPLPEKIIALTTTPFDKFRLSRSIRRVSDGKDTDEADRYAYLGLRDRTGRASTTAAIFRALEGLFEASRSSDERRHGIADVFAFLGYLPRIEVRYDFALGRGRRLLEQLVTGEQIEKILYEAPPLRQRRPIDRLRYNPVALEEVREVGQEVLARLTDGRGINLLADFDGRTRDDDLFRRIQLLRRLDLVHMASVEVQRSQDNAVLDLRLASSGELGIVTGFLGVASVISRNSLVFVDEPEISLHPEWQARYVELLTSTFARFGGCHFVLATHSPIILSDINPAAANVVSLDPERRKAESASGFAGKSYDFLLATAFDEPGNNNLYIKEEIIKALRLAADGQIKSTEFVDTLAALSEFLPRLDTESPVARLIAELHEAASLEEMS